MPCEFVALIIAFAPLFSKPVFQHAQVLLMGAMLSPGKRTVTSALRVMGLSQDAQFQNYHRVLNRARWSGLAASQVLLGLLVSAFAPTGTIVLGLDDTIERRRGKKITAKGIYRDPVRSSPVSSGGGGQGERLALAVLDAAGRDSVGRPGVGVALSDRAVPVGAVLQGARARTPQADGSCPADAGAGGTLAARPRDRRHRRPEFRRLGTPPVSSSGTDFAGTPTII